MAIITSASGVTVTNAAGQAVTTFAETAQATLTYTGKVLQASGIIPAPNTGSTNATYTGVTGSARAHEITGAESRGFVSAAGSATALTGQLVTASGSISATLSATGYVSISATLSAAVNATLLASGGQGNRAHLVLAAQLAGAANALTGVIGTSAAVYGGITASAHALTGAVAALSANIAVHGSATAKEPVIATLAATELVSLQSHATVQDYIRLPYAVSYSYPSPNRAAGTIKALLTEARTGATASSSITVLLAAQATSRTPNTASIHIPISGKATGGLANHALLAVPVTGAANALLGAVGVVTASFTAHIHAHVVASVNATANNTYNGIGFASHAGVGMGVSGTVSALLTAHAVQGMTVSASGVVHATLTTSTQVISPASAMLRYSSYTLAAQGFVGKKNNGTLTLSGTTTGVLGATSTAHSTLSHTLQAHAVTGAGSSVTAVLQHTIKASATVGVVASASGSVALSGRATASVIIGGISTSLRYGAYSVRATGNARARARANLTTRNPTIYARMI